jgi:hypothetical protein
MSIKYQGKVIQRPETPKEEIKDTPITIDYLKDLLELWLQDSNGCSENECCGSMQTTENCNCVYCLTCAAIMAIEAAYN